MATPTLRALRTGFPDSKIVGIMRPPVAQLLAGLVTPGGQPWIDEIILFNKRRAKAPVVSRWGLIGAVRRKRLDSMILLPNSLWPALVAKLAGIKRLVGYARDGRGPLLENPLPVPTLGGKRLPVSAVDYYLYLAKWMGCSIADRRMQLSTETTDEQLRRSLFERLGLDPRLPTVVLNSNSATQPLRLWPAERVTQLARRLADEAGLQVLFHCGPGERESANAMAASIDNPLVASMGLVDDLPIGLSKAVLANADTVVSTDSGPRHIAVAFDRPVVSLFGPTDVQWTQTYNVPETILAGEFQCRPCYSEKCSMGDHRCMTNISVQQVVNAIRHRLMSHRFAA